MDIVADSWKRFKVKRKAWAGELYRKSAIPWLVRRVDSSTLGEQNMTAKSKDRAAKRKHLAPNKELPSVPTDAIPRKRFPTPNRPLPTPPVRRSLSRPPQDPPERDQPAVARRRAMTMRGEKEFARGNGEKEVGSKVPPMIMEMLEVNRCTYGLTGRKKTLQRMYQCVSCEDVVLFCESCAALCHEGHTLIVRGIVEDYCECGAGESRPGIRCAACK